MGKTYDKPAIIGSTKIEPQPDSCQQGDEASPPGTKPARQTPDRPGSTGKRRGHLKIVRK